MAVGEPRRPPLRPDPAINQNDAGRLDPVVPPRAPLRIAAWVVVLPFYIAAATVSIVILIAFAREMLHL